VIITSSVVGSLVDCVDRAKVGILLLQRLNVAVHETLASGSIFVPLLLQIHLETSLFLFASVSPLDFSKQSE